MARRGNQRGRGRGNARNDVNFGVDADVNPPVGRNDEQRNQRDEIDELRREVATLTGLVRRLQPPNEGSEDFDDTPNNFENPFGFPQRNQRFGEMNQHLGARNETKWDPHLKDYPEFQGSLNPDEFVDWLNAIERLFDYHDVPEGRKVKLVAVRLKGRASAWWEQLQVSRQRHGKGKIREWGKMKKKLNEQYLPFNYLQSLYKTLHNLKQVGSVAEYTGEFYELIARVDLNESEEQRVTRYLSGLKPSIQDVICLQPLWTVSETYNKALLVEKQQNKGVIRAGQQLHKAGLPFQNQYRANTSSNVGKTGVAAGGQQVKPTTTTPNQSNANRFGVGTQAQGNFKCFKCGEPGHKSSDCRRANGIRGKALLMEEVEESDMNEDLPLYDQPLNEEIGGDSDKEEGLALMLRKTLLAPKVESEEDWLRTNIFYSTCSIGGRVCNLIIDGGSCENVVSQEVVNKLNLKTEEHPHPYRLSWFKKGNEVKVNQRCLVSFSIRKKYFDEVWCDVVPMDACHVLLGRPWQYDRKTIHDGEKNTYSFSLGKQQYMLLPMKEKVISKPKITTLLTSKSFLKESKESGYVLALFPMGKVADHETPVVV